MSDNHTNRVDPNVDADQSKKPSQADAIKRILERKKQAQQQANGRQGNHSTDGKKMKTQIHKVQNNQKRRTGV
ncbi:hypothetical protein [Cohnella herbarum]|uniref:Uncharacterized protein n=1 Tax=Cohnella herbarum TaxID=2728023 RepID=A0A7Z2VK53_9BACL|nr:hypothetical protein [Cohnella herbarum]QJD84496.1 hypothetical protein HH215_15810 [Cohnella herbarum]